MDFKKRNKLIHTLCRTASLCLLFSALSRGLAAQQLDEIILIEPNSAEDAGQLDFSQQLEQTEYLLKEPVNLNKATRDALKNSTLFSDLQILELTEHIAINGPLLSLYELQVIPSFNLNFIQGILHYVKLNSSIENYHVSFSHLISKGDYQFFFRYHQSFPQKKAYQTNAYTGRPNQLYARFKYQYSNKLYYGLTGEKDAGEQFFGQKNKLGFDFYSGYFFWRMNKKIKVLALGDYHLNLGQGLVLYTGFGFNKTSNVCAVKKEAATLKPYTSINEYAYLRGGAMSIQFNNFTIIPFVSIKKVDASIRFTDSTELTTLSTRLQFSGFHRTLSEIEGKKQLLETHVGAKLQYADKNYHVALNFLNTSYSDSISFIPKLYNQFQFQGKTLHHMSLDYHYLLKKAHLFGESAFSMSGKQITFATLNACMLNPAKILSLTIVHRYYSPFYQVGALTNAFGESTSPVNEQGIYMGVSIKPKRQITLSSYIDYFLFPWLRFQTLKPSQGYDFLLLGKFSLSKKLEFYFNYKREAKQQNTSVQLNRNNAVKVTSSNQAYFDAYFPDFQVHQEDGLSYLSPNARITKQEIEAANFVTPHLSQRLRFHLSYSISPSWKMQTRLECNFIKDQINAPSRGILIYQDLKFKSIHQPFGFSTRLSLFDIRQYSNRIYAYESDVLHQFSIPAFFNAGLRYYFNFQYRLTQNIQLWLRFSHTYYKNIDVKGSGNEEINSNKLYDFKVQLRLKF